jgi:hypothetical protein
METAAQQQGYDSTQEMRAMILAALPYPPLPVALRRLEDGNALGDEVLQTSHDIISNMLVESCAKGSAAENASRRRTQVAVLGDLLRALTADGLQEPPQLYATYCTFTARHIASYVTSGGGAIPEIRFLPLGHVCKGDSAHLRMCDYMAGQARLLALDEGLAAQDWLSYEYAQMLCIARNRLVFEREAAPPQAGEGGDEEAGDAE